MVDVVQESGISPRTLGWRGPTKRAQASLANRSDAARDGAYAVAIATVEAELGLFAPARTDVRTGADYFIGQPGQDLEDCLRLEVAGIHSEASELKSHLSRKVRQLRGGTWDLPGFACVVGFKAKKIALSGVILKTEEEQKR